MIAIAPRWPWLVAFIAAGGVAALAASADRRPAALNATNTCSALLRAACERQQACPGCAPLDVTCAALVTEQLPLCLAHTAPGEEFNAVAVDACVRAFADQPCPLACSTFEDPEACKSLQGISPGAR